MAGYLIWKKPRLLMLGGLLCAWSLLFGFDAIDCAAFIITAVCSYIAHLVYRKTMGSWVVRCCLGFIAAGVYSVLRIIWTFGQFLVLGRKLFNPAEIALLVASFLATAVSRRIRAELVKL